MRCRGIDHKETKKRSKTVHCNTELDEHQIFCHVCGHPTPALKNDLSAKNNLKKVFAQYKQNYSQHLMLGVILALITYVTAAALFLFAADNYWLTNLILLFSVPLLLIPFAQKGNLTLPAYGKALLRFYPHYWFFVLLAELYFFLLKVICTGYLLDIMIDPVLHIVRLIMVLYGIACALAVPLLIGEKNMNPLQAIITSIKGGYETRWQLFFTSVYALVINLLGVIALLAGLLYTLPLSYQIIRSYYLKMQEYELFIYPNPRPDLKEKKVTN